MLGKAEIENSFTHYTITSISVNNLSIQFSADADVK